ncbi:unnamed protein product [Closterium sp. NIES-54]
MFRAVDPPLGDVPGEVAVDSDAARGTAFGGAEPRGAEPVDAEPGGAEPWGAETGGAEPEGAEPEGVEPVGAESEGAECRGAEPHGAGSQGTTSSGVAAGAGVTRGTAAAVPGGARTWGTVAPGNGGLGGAVARDPTESGAVGAEGSGAGGVGAGGAGVGGTALEALELKALAMRRWGAGAGGAGAIDLGGNVRPFPYFIPMLKQVLGFPSSTSLTPPLLCPPPNQSQLPLLPTSPLPAPSPNTEKSGGFTERREPVSHPISPVRAARRVPHSRPPPVPGTHSMALHPSPVPLRVPQPAPPESSLPEVPDPESDRTRAASPTVSRLLAAVVTDPSYYTTSLVAEFASASPPSVGGECALGTDVLEDKQEDFECLAAALPHFISMLLAPEGDPDAPDISTPCSYAEAITGLYSSHWQSAMDAKMASLKSRGTYVDEAPPPGANIVDGMWISRVKRPPGSPPAFKARYVARGFCQRQGVDYFQTFSPTPKMTSLRVLLRVAAQHGYELRSLDSSTVFLQGSLHEEIWLRCPPGFTGSFPAGTQWSLRWPVYGLRQAHREWHDT